MSLFYLMWGSVRFVPIMILCHIPTQFLYFFSCFQFLQRLTISSAWKEDSYTNKDDAMSHKYEQHVHVSISPSNLLQYYSPHYPVLHSFSLERITHPPLFVFQYIYMQLCLTKKHWTAIAKDVELTNEGRYKLHNQMHDRGNITESLCAYIYRVQQEGIR